MHVKTTAHEVRNIDMHEGKKYWYVVIRFTYSRCVTEIIASAFFQKAMEEVTGAQVIADALKTQVG